MASPSVGSPIRKRVYIASYPRSGNTWVRLLLEHSLGFETKSDSTDRRRQPFGVLGAEHLAREPTLDLMKSHANFLPGDDDVIYVVRDGRDATASYWHYLRDRQGRPVGSFSEFLQSLPMKGDWWPFHVHSWLEADHSHRLLLVRYEDLMKDQEQELARLLDFLGLQPIRPFRDYAARISFESVHARQPTFFRRGQMGAWREVFSQDDERFFLAHDLGYLTSLGYLREEERPPGTSSSSNLGRDPLVRSLIRRMNDLQCELEKKEAVIQEQRRAIEAFTAHMDGCQSRQASGEPTGNV